MRSCQPPPASDLRRRFSPGWSAAATASVRQGVTLLAVYSLGLAVPFLLATVLLDRFMVRRARFVVWLPRVERLNGALIILIGALLLTGTLERLASQAARLRAP